MYGTHQNAVGAMDERARASISTIKRAPATKVVSKLSPARRRLPVGSSTSNRASQRRRDGHSKNNVNDNEDQCSGVEDLTELRDRRLAMQSVALAVADRATALLGSQRDREVLDLRPSAAALDDVLMDELALQLRANVSRADARVFSTIVFCGCEKFTAVGMRPFVHAMGARIKRLDFSSTALPLDVVKVLATGLETLDSLDLSSCRSPPLTTEGIRALLFSGGCSGLTSLRASSCAALTDDAIGAFVNLKKLCSLDVSYSTALTDRGFQALAKTCRSLQFVNLEGLDRLSNAGVRHLVRSCRGCLRVLSLRRCKLLTDSVLATIGDREHGARELRSLNVSGCDRLTSSGLLAMTPGTPVLQALNVAGCVGMDERILAALATDCSLLQVLNVEGCVDVTNTGIKTLATHLPFVEQATHYRGLAPRVDATQRKFALHAQTIADSAALRIQACLRGLKGRRRAAIWRERVVLTPAVKRIRRAYVCWRLNRLICGRVDRRKLLRSSIVKIQALVRGVMCRIHLEHELREQKRLALWAIHAVKIQSVYRSHYVRTRSSSASVSRVMARYRLEKELFAREAAATKLQHAYRARFHRSRLDDIIAINQRRRREVQAAAVLVQRAYRARGARRAYLMLLDAVHAQQAIVRNMVRYATKLQSRWRGHYARNRELTRVREAALTRERVRYAAASRINAGVRGFFARRLARHERVLAATRLRAARVIERAWRVYKTPNAERIAYEAMLRRMKQNIAAEVDAAGKQQRELLRVARELCEQDSASEPESDDDWRDFADEQGDTFWFSPSRGERVYMRPNENAVARCLLGMLCRVYWPLEDVWFNGRITRYNRGKDKHRIEYDDGDHEWLSLTSTRDRHRVQLFTGQCWCMLSMFEPSTRAVRAVIFVGVRVQLYDHRYMGWRSGVTLGYNEVSDAFLVNFDSDYTGEGASKDEWMELFRMEDVVQMQDAQTSQWHSLSGYVFGATRGRPLDFFQRLRTRGIDESLYYYYSVSDFLDYVGPPVTQEDAAALEHVEVDHASVGGDAGDGDEDGDSEQDERSDEESDDDGGAADDEEDDDGDDEYAGGEEEEEDADESGDDQGGDEDDDGADDG